MPLSDALKKQGVLALIACDFSYADEMTRNERLRSIPDNNPKDEQAFPTSLLDTFSVQERDTSSSPYHSVPGGKVRGVDTVVFDNWYVEQSFKVPETGFGAVLLRNHLANANGKFDYIVAFRGTDGPNGQDWFANLDLAREVWALNGAAVMNVLQQLPDANSIVFTGQSLGGGLAQYGLYDYVNRLRGAPRPTLSLITFNAFGGIRGIQSIFEGFESSLVSSIPTAHYTIDNDVVHRLGQGEPGQAGPGGTWHVNGTGNFYQFSFASYDEDGRVKIHPDLGTALPDFIEAHRIERGFYRGIEYSQALFTSAKQMANPDYIDSLQSQTVAAALSRIFNKGFTTELSATARLVAGLAAVGVAGDPREINRFTRELTLNAYRAAKLHKIWKKVIDNAGLGWGLKLASRPLTNVIAVSTAIATAIEVFSGLTAVDRDKIVDALNEFMPSDRLIPKRTPSTIQELSDGDKALLAHTAKLSLGRYATDEDLGEMFADPSDRALVAALRPSGINEEQFFAALDSGAGWIRNSLANLAQAIVSGDVLTAAEEAVAVQRLEFSVARNTLTLVGADEALVGRVKSDLYAFLQDMARAVANAHPDAVARQSTPITLPGTASYQEFRAHAAGFLEGLQQFGEAAITMLRGASPESEVDVGAIREAVQDASQAVVVRAGRGRNPFDADSFDANEVVSVDLHEGAASPYTVYLPYEAGEGGQRVRFDLSGPAADKIDVTNAEVEDGSFTITIPEGQREFAFGLWAREDVNADAVLKLSATLVDGAGVATHSTHEEATIRVDAESEVAAGGAALDLHGDWGVAMFPVLDERGRPILDGNGEQLFAPMVDERFPHRLNMIRSMDATGGAWPYGHLVGSDGPDHIWLGEHGADWQGVGMGGNDHLEGKPDVRNLIVGDHDFNSLGFDGNDTLEGGENPQPYNAGGFIYADRLIEEVGDDVMNGGAGNDLLVADRIALLDQVLDPDTPMRDQKGDWIQGELGDDRIYGSAAHDALFGGGGADIIRAGAGNDVLDGDDNYYTAAYAWWDIVAEGPFLFRFFPVINVRVPGYPLEYYRDYGGADILDGGSGNDIILGMLGDDTLIGGDGDDTLQGWEGEDQLFGGDGNDVLAGDFGRDESAGLRLSMSGYDVMPGVVGEVVLSGQLDQIGNDYLDGGAGDDELTGEAGDDTLIGGDGADSLVGDADYLDASLHGADLLDGGAGSDSLEGQGGDDVLHGGPDADSMRGGEGNDVADGGTGADQIEGGQGDDLLKGGAGADVIAGDAGDDELQGGSGEDDLDGGEGDDRLYGGDGVDRLTAGDGNDELFGGSGEDVLEGGDGNDLLDGGAGAEILRGGAGDDTYVFGLGYGTDRIDDRDGENHIRFGIGVTPDDVTASLDEQTLSTTVTLGFGGDSITFSMSQSRVGTVEFGDGAAWSREQLLQFVPALTTAGSSDGEAISGSPFLRNDLQGFGGDDEITGSANDDRLEGGDGADALDGAAGSDVYSFSADETGVDLLSDSDIGARAYLDWFYANAGIADWIERGAHGGQYQAIAETDGDRSVRYFDSYEEAQAEFPDATISFIEPLPAIAPLIRGDDAGAFDQLVQAGVLSRDVVEFGTGLGLSDLGLTVTVNRVDAEEHPEQPWFGGGTLAVRWGDAGFDVSVPGTNYGFVGANLHTDGTDPLLDLPGAWRGYRLGEGIEEFRFSDGSVYSLEEVLQLAEVHEVLDDYRLLVGSGDQTISRRYGAVLFDSYVGPEHLSVTREGTDLILTIVDGAAQARVEGWYDDPSRIPPLTLEFSSGEEIGPATLTEMALRVSGTDGDDVIAGLDGYGDVLSGGPGHDVLDGGTGKDTYVFRRGDGTDRVTDTPEDGSDASVVVFPDYFSWEASLGLGSLAVDFLNGDAVHFTAFDPDAPYEAPVFDRLEFADGVALTYEELLAGGFWLYGTDGDDVITGTAIEDRIFGAAGSDVLSGAGGDDSLEGGDGDDVLMGGPGRDYLSGDAGSDVYVYSAGDGSEQIFDFEGELDTLRLVDTTAAQIRVTQDAWSYHLLLEDGNRLLLDTMVQDASAVIERIEFGDGLAWSASDLAAAVELFPATEGDDDSLWGTPEGETLDGLAGADFLFGNEGDDLLIGGEGQDYYYFAAGHGHDVIDNADSDGLADTIYFAYAASGDVQLAKSGDDLALRIGPDSVSLAGWFGETGSNYGILFEVDGVFWDDATLAELAGAIGGSAPELATPIPDQAANEDLPFSFLVPPGTFSDPDEGDALTYSASQLDGSALPDWIGFDAATATLSGVPTQGDVGSLDLLVTATDSSGMTASAGFVLTVAATNDAPAVANPLTARFYEAGSAFSFTVPTDTFLDEDIEDSLTYSVVRYGGGPLPEWLHFDAVTATFVGTPGPKENGLSRIVVAATDAAGESASSDLGLVIYAVSGSSVTGRKGDDLLYGGAGDETLTAKAGNDALFGGQGSDLLKGGAGNDVLQGQDGNDELRGGVGQNLLDGGSGNDVIHGGQGTALIAGGAGDDTIRAGSGRDIILFNRGDGIDTLIADRAGDNTLSFGGGIGYSDLTLSREGKNLIVGTGDSDRIVLKNWYSGKHSVLNLQIVLDASEEFDAASADPLYNRKVQTFDFLGLVNQFDRARAQSPGLSSWHITNALLEFHLSGADDMALGGDLAYWYGRNRSFEGISVAAAQQLIGASTLGAEAQSLRPFNGLQEGFAKLT